DVPVLQSAEPAFSGGPKRPVPVESKVTDHALAQPVGGCIRCLELTAIQIRHAPVKKSKPYAALQRINGQNTGMVLMSQLGPRNLLDLISRGHTKETVILVGDAHIPRIILGDTVHGSAGNSAYGYETVILQVAAAVNRRDPDSPAIILKQ